MHDPIIPRTTKSPRVKRMWVNWCLVAAASLARTALRCWRAYILPLCFFFFFFFLLLIWPLILEVNERISTKLRHTFTYDCYLKNLVWTSPGIYLHRLGAKKTLLGTNFEFWPNISLQWNIISTIRKKLVNLQGLPYMPPKFDELWSTNGWQRLASYCPRP